LNVPLKAQEDPTSIMAKWQACGGDVDAAQWPEYDVDLLVTSWGLLKQPAGPAWTTSWTTDLTAIVFVFAV